MVLSSETEQLLDAQRELGEQLEKIRKNFKKDGAKRKSVGYLRGKMNTTIGLWNEFHDNHSILVGSPDLPLDDGYLKDKFKTQIEVSKDQFIAELRATATSLYPNEDIFEVETIIPPSSLDLGIINIRMMLDALNQVLDEFDVMDVSLKTPPRIQEIKLELRSNWKNIQELHSRLVKEAPTYDATSYVNMGKKLKTYAPTLGNLNVDNAEPILSCKYKQSTTNLKMMLEAFNESLDEFSSLDASRKTPEFLKETRKRLQFKWKSIDEMHSHLLQESTVYDATLYVDIEKKLKTFVPQLGNFDIIVPEPIQPPIINPNNNVFDNVKLPKITIPKFEGDYAKWNQFAELFTEMVGSKNISGTQKLLYLKQNIHGEAAKLVNHLMLTEANYDVAWQILRARYANRRLIVTTLIDKICMAEQVKVESAGAVKKMHDIVAENIRVLRSMNISGADLASILLHHIVIKKLDDSSHQLYEQTLTDSRAIPNIDTLLDFTVKRFQALEALGKKPKQTGGSTSSHKQPNVHQKGTSLMVPGSGKIKNSCGCEEKHPWSKCPKFLDLDPKKRYSAIKKLNLCANCFKPGHKTDQCTFRKCMKCDKKHNTLLHFDVQKALFGSTIKNKGFQHVFLASVLVNVLDKNGIPIKMRALLDSGSQLNIITEKMHKKLNIDFQSANMTIQGIGVSEVEAKKRSIIDIESQHSNFKTKLEVFVVRKITTCQPEKEIDISNWNIPTNVKLADPKFNIPAGVDLTIGAEIFFKLISTGIISIGPNLPQLQNTVFGWIVTGKLFGKEKNHAYSGIGISKESTLDQQVNRFWQIEERYKEEQPFSKEEEWCEKFYENTTKRDKTGRFIVRLQFSKNPESLIGASREMAVRRFLYLEKRFQRDHQLRNEYVKFMDEYEQLGHMEVIRKDDVGKYNYFIPHHSVLNPASSTTKFRVVFDASAKSSTNRSLNELLLNGPMLQDDLFSIMVRFRKHEYVFSSDIGKMYRQILVHPKDQRWQLIVWRNNPLHELKFYKLKTLTYGTTCASYLAIKTMQTLADGVTDRFPLAAAVAKQDFNVDDVMTGTDNILEAVQLQSELIEMFKLAGMQLHKWCANHPMLLKNIPKKHQEVSLEINAEKTETKALGMKWIPSTDMFMLHYDQRGHTKTTKRTILSETAQLFDPLGLVNPVIVLAKIFIQELWMKKIDWDEVLPIELQNKWKAFRAELSKLNCVSVPRHMIIPSAINVQLHIFSDASMKAYGAVAYLRSESSSGEIMVNLVCSKSRVAPVNVITLPRLELCGAVIMMELAEKLKKTLKIKFDDVKLWTDSEIVLSWVLNAGSYKTFVANRISRLNRKTKSTDWRFISTKENPADLISRGVFPDKLLKSDLWWHGPAFLKQHESEWPSTKANFIREEIEEKTTKTVLLTQPVFDHVIDHIRYRNSIDTLQRVLAFCMKFSRKNRESSNDESIGAILQTNDLQRAMMEIVRYVQQKHLQADYDHIKDGHPEKTKFGNLYPLIDKYGIIRVGGRLQKSTVPFEQKHPALLPKGEKLTRLIMERIHLKNMHAGPQALLAITRQHFWPIDGKKLASSIVHQCVLCARHKPKLMQQVMGTLPTERVEAARCFVHVGVDFAGPIMVHYQTRGKKPTKAFVCLFVCFATKAVHIEAATDMSTDAFISCLKRFIARRGIPSKIFCDNGTNFVGAKNKLDELAQIMSDPINQSAVIKYCWDHYIEWKFIPPRSPHFGGLWESAIKSAKLHLIKILHNFNCTFVELSTILAEIESILNSRPLTPMSSNPNDLQPLTAGHFLIGEPLRCLNDQLLPSRSKIKMWHKLIAIKSEFWKRWSKEYLAELQYRNKWQKDHKNIKVGTLVTLKDGNLPPLHWRMGRITSIIPDDDGNIRVVMVKTATGILKRDIHELCPLPVDDESPPLTPSLDTSSSKSPLPQISTIVNELADNIKNGQNVERWSNDYLIELHHRHKWTKLNLTVGTLILIKNENFPPLQWEMGRIDTVSPSPNVKGVPQMVSVKTKNGITKRNINEIFPLPAEYESAFTTKDDNSTLSPAMQKIKSKSKNSSEPVKQFISNVCAPKMLKNHLTKKNTKSGAPSSPKTTINSSRVTRSGRKYGTTLSTTYFMIIFGLLATLAGILGNPCNVTSFANNPGLYFEEIGQISLTSDDWTLISYFDMDTYWQQAENIKLLIQHLDTACPAAHPDGPNYCETILQQFRHQFNSIQAKNNLLQAFSQLEHSRKKRGWFDAGGKAAKQIFGILNEDDAKHYDEQIKQVNENSNHLMDLIRNQTTMQEITSNIILHNEKMIAKKFQYIANEIKILHKKTDVSKTNIFNLIVIQVLTTIGGYREIQSTLLDLLTDVHHSKIPPTVVTPEQLNQQMLKIMHHIPPTLMIPGSDKVNQISKLYSMLVAQVRVTKRNLIVRIKIPLINREHFKLFHITPAPFYAANSLRIILPSTSYMGVNLKQDHYYMLSNLEHEKCKVYDEGQLICNQLKPLYSVHHNTSQCEITVMLHPLKAPEQCNIVESRKHQYWSSLSKRNQYLFAVQEPGQISIICNSESQKTVQNCDIHGFGIITVNQQCMIKSGQMEISSHNSMSSDIVPAMLIPSVNISDVLTSKYNNTPQSFAAEIWEDFQKNPQYDVLRNAIKLQHENERFTTINPHHVHHYILSYILGMIVIIIVVAYCLRRKGLFQPHPNLKHDENNESHSIELRSMHVNGNPASFGNHNSI